MNLIEQLGGYESAKSKCDRANKEGYLLLSVPVQNGFGDIYVHKVEEALLEYRRANNIYEVGDKVVLAGDGTWGHLFEVEKMSPKGRKPTKLKTDVFGNFHVGCNVVRHATDAEIKAGKRLELTNGKI